MTREEALKVLEMFLHKQCDLKRTEFAYDANTVWNAVNMASKVLEQEPNIDMESEEIKNLQKRAYLEGFHEASKMLVKQESKTGHWIDNKCSVCGKGTEDLIDSREWYQNEDPKYCPFCGVKLIDS